MDEQAAANAFTNLRQVLVGRLGRDGELLLREVDLEIAAGKRLVKDVSVLDEVDSEAPTTARRRVRAAFVGSLPFTENEKLEILVDAMRLVMVAPGRMLERLRGELRDDDAVAPRRVTFLGEADPPDLIRAVNLDPRQRLDTVLDAILERVDTELARSRKARGGTSDTID